MLLNGEEADQLVKDGLLYRLCQFTSLTADAARSLARSDDWCLELDGLTELEAEAGIELGRHNGAVSLNGLTKLSAPAAAGLARCPGSLSLNGLRQLSVEVAAALATHHSNPLLLNSLRSITALAAEQLARHRGYLELNGLYSLCPAAAKMLATRTDPWTANGIRYLSETAALELSRAPCLLSLGSYRVPAESSGYLALARSMHELDLSGLKHLSPKVAEALFTEENALLNLSLSGLRNLDIKTARALSSFPAPLHLEGLSTLDPDVAAELSVAKAPFIYLTGLKDLPDPAALALASSRGTVVLGEYLGDVLTADLARLILSQRSTSDDYQDFELPSIEFIEDEAAEVLARSGVRFGTVRLAKLRLLTPVIARSLASITAHELSLNGLADLPDEASNELSQTSADLFLRGLDFLSDVAIDALVRNHSGWLILGELSCVSEVAAERLCQRTAKVAIEDFSKLPLEIQSILQKLPM